MNGRKKITAAIGAARPAAVRSTSRPTMRGVLLLRRADSAVLSTSGSSNRSDSQIQDFDSGFIENKCKGWEEEKKIQFS